MGWIRKILWLCGGIIFIITFLTMLSQVYLEGLGWSGINGKTYVFWYIFGSIFIGSMFIYDLISYLLLRSEVHRLMDETEQINSEEIAKILEAPLWRVRPIFRKREEPGILINISGKYLHFNEAFQEKFIEQYANRLTIGELARHFNLSKTDVNLIIDELDYKGILPEVEAPSDRPKQDEPAPGLRKTVRLRKKLKKKHRK
jgi:uncharacterized membrane protein